MPRRIASPSRSVLEMLKAHGVLLFSLLAVMWAMEIVDHLPYIELDGLGVRPRTVTGLIGIVCSPFLHTSFGHLFANSIPFLILGGVVLLGGTGLFWRVTAIATLGGGLCVWLFAGRLTNHIGASGLVFGYLGFLLARGFFEKSLPWILAGFAILILYGGLLFGVLPTRVGVSWQGHLFGFLAGVGAARWLCRRA